MSAVKHKLFVYGTLRPPKVSATHVLSGYAMYDCGHFPYILPSHGKDVVLGNLVDVSDKELEELDHYEGVNRGFYAREKVWVIDSLGKCTKAFVYIGGTVAPRRIEGGDWFKRFNS